MLRVNLLLGMLVVSALACGLPTPRRVSNQVFGGPCLETADCGAGLTCEHFLASKQGGSPEEVNSLCTLACSPSACPPGSLCLAGSGATEADAGAPMLCVPTCQSDADCQRGGRVQACAPAPTPCGPGEVECPARGPRVCQYLECEGHSYGDTYCPSPNCTKECESGATCVAQPGQGGFCER